MLPCSRVGHIYRKKTPYTFPGGGATHVVTYNSNRLANVWLDQWMTFYYLINPGMNSVSLNACTQLLIFKFLSRSTKNEGR